MSLLGIERGHRLGESMRRKHDSRTDLERVPPTPVAATADRESTGYCISDQMKLSQGKRFIRMAGKTVILQKQNDRLLLDMRPATSAGSLLRCNTPFRRRGISAVPRTGISTIT